MKNISVSRKNLKQLIKQFSATIRANDYGAKAKRLLQEIKFILSQLRYRLSGRELRRIVGGVAIVASLAFSNNTHGQAAFLPPVNNPFGTSATNQFAFPAEGDLDSDGDLDLIVNEYNGAFQYFENTGTSTAPSFAAASQNPFGLASVNNWGKPNLVDLDNDGDLDLLVSEYNYNATTYAYSADIKYFENIGTATAPNFAAPILNPFGIPSLANSYFRLPEMVDLDNDGDYDLLSIEYNPVSYNTEYRYYQNNGTAAVPSFGAAVSNPFGLTLLANSYLGFANLDDLDGDGDFDLLLGESDYTGNFLYQENIGTAALPNFGSIQTNPFGLTATNQTTQYQKINSPVLLDLDSDGDLDIISGEYGGNLLYFQNTDIYNGGFSIANLSINAPSCSPGGDATISTLGLGGIGPITYKIANDSNTNGQFSNYSVGTYTLSLRDSMNNIVDSVITINASVPPIIDTLNSSAFDITCNGLLNGSISVVGSGGTSPYTFNLNPGGPNTTGFYSNLAAGTYLATVTDSKNCISTSQTFIINQPPATIFTVDSSTNISCFGGNDGAIYTTASGGTGGFTYSISPAAGSQMTPGDFTNLNASNYFITALDGNGCSTQLNHTLTEPTAIILNLSAPSNASSSTAADGSFSALASGGTPSYTYTISPNVGTQTPPGSFINLPANTYTITATDANGCTETSTNIVSFEFASGLNDLSKLNVSVYPNPVENMLRIESKESIAQASILDMTGRAILISEENNNQIPMGQLPSGIYILKVILDDGTEGKMLIQKK